MRVSGPRVAPAIANPVPHLARAATCRCQANATGMPTSSSASAARKTGWGQSLRRQAMSRPTPPRNTTPIAARSAGESSTTVANP